MSCSLSDSPFGYFFIEPITLDNIRWHLNATGIAAVMIGLGLSPFIYLFEKLGPELGPDGVAQAGIGRNKVGNWVGIPD